MPEGGSERRSLFRYFQGRSSLATWLRAVLSQRYVDRLRAQKRLEPLPDEDDAARPSRRPRGDPPDPDRSRHADAAARGAGPRRRPARQPRPPAPRLLLCAGADAGRDRPAAEGARSDGVAAAGADPARAARGCRASAARRRRVERRADRGVFRSRRPKTPDRSISAMLAIGSCARNRRRIVLYDGPHVTGTEPRSRRVGRSAAGRHAEGARRGGARRRVPGRRDAGGLGRRRARRARAGGAPKRMRPTADAARRCWRRWSGRCRRRARRRLSSDARCCGGWRRSLRSPRRWSIWFAVPNREPVQQSRSRRDCRRRAGARGAPGAAADAKASGAAPTLRRRERLPISETSRRRRRRRAPPATCANGEASRRSTRRRAPTPAAAANALSEQVPVAPAAPAAAPPACGAGRASAQAADATCAVTPRPRRRGSRPSPRRRTSSSSRRTRRRGSGCCAAAACSDPPTAARPGAPKSTGATETLMAGSSPSPSVCWLVGPSGTVLLSTDGRSWRRVAFPETVRSAGGHRHRRATTRRSRPPTAASSSRPTAARPGPDRRISEAFRLACKISRRLRSKDRTAKEPFMQTRIGLALAAVADRRRRSQSHRTSRRPPRPRRGRRRTGLVDARRSDRSRRHRLQLRHRAGARRPRAAAAARHLRSAVHGHRRDGQSGDRAFPIADRAVARQRARAELRVRPARARQAAAQVRRPRRRRWCGGARRTARRARKR